MHMLLVQTLPLKWSQSQSRNRLIQISTLNRITRLRGGVGTVDAVVDVSRILSSLRELNEMAPRAEQGFNRGEGGQSSG